MFFCVLLWLQDLGARQISHGITQKSTETDAGLEPPLAQRQIRALAALAPLPDRVKISLPNGTHQRVAAVDMPFQKSTVRDFGARNCSSFALVSYRPPVFIQGFCLMVSKYQ